MCCGSCPVGMGAGRSLGWDSLRSENLDFLPTLAVPPLPGPLVFSCLFYLSWLQWSCAGRSLAVELGTGPSCQGWCPPGHCSCWWTGPQAQAP